MVGVACGQTGDAEEQDLWDGPVSQAGKEGGPVKDVVKRDMCVAEVELDKLLAQSSIRDHKRRYVAGAAAVPYAAVQRLVPLLRCSRCRREWLYDSDALDTPFDAKVAADARSRAVAFLSPIAEKGVNSGPRRGV